MEANYNETYDYKEINLLPFHTFQQRCKLMFDMVFNPMKYDFIADSHYYCGEGSHWFTIYDKEKSTNELYTILQNDFSGDLYFMVYCGNYDINYSCLKEYHFKSLTEALNFIISLN